MCMLKIKLLLIFCLLLILYNRGNCQKKESIFYYEPNGSIVTDSSFTKMDNLIEKHFDKELRFYIYNAFINDKRLYVDKGLFAICFKVLTKEPIVLLATRKMTPETIRLLLEPFKTKPYYNTRKFYDHLKEFTKLKSLNKSYILEALGEPDNITEATMIESEKWQYEKLKLHLTFDENIVSYFKLTNYADHIEKKENKIDKIKFFNAPSIYSYFSLSKVINNGEIHYFLELSSMQEFRIMDMTTVIVLQNGKIISRNNMINPSEGELARSFSHIYLNQTEAAMLASSPIVEYKLGDVHEVVRIDAAEDLMNYFKVLLLLK